MNMENRFILNCITMYLKGDFYVINDKRFKRMNIKRLNDSIHRHNLCGVFHYLNDGGCFESMDIPDGLKNTWKLEFWKNSFTNEENDKTAAAVSSFLDEEGVNYSYLKGATIRAYHRNTDVFSSADTDIFIDRDDYIKAKTVLINSGFSIPDPDKMMKGTELSLNEYEEYMNEIMFVREDSHLSQIIDIQWDFIGMGGFELFQKLYDINDYILTNSYGRFTINGTSLKIMPLEKQFYAMCFHFAFHHGFRGLKWLIDMGMYYVKENPTPEGLCGGLTESGRKTIGITVMLLNELLGIPKPSGKTSRELCIDRLLPFEYSLYRNMLLRTGTGVWNSITHRIVKILLPYKHRDKFRVMRYILFNTESIKHRTDPAKGRRGISHLFSLLRIFIRDSRHRKDG